MKRTIFPAVLGTAALLGAVQAGAATQIIDGSGKLTGATGVTVGGATYNVDFVEGTCSGLFSGCSAFTFQNATDAGTAAQALLDQVFTGAFNSDYTKTYGCDTNSYSNAIITGACLALIPFSFTDGQFQAAAALNSNTTDSSDSIVSGDPDFFDTTFNNAFVWARFTPTTGAVPEPATWAMMLLGLGAIGAVLRRRRDPAAA